MVLKNYYIRTQRNLKEEIMYIDQTYNASNPRQVGLFTNGVIRAKINFATDNEEIAFIQDMTQRGAINLAIDDQIIDLSTYQKIAIDNKLIFQITQNVQLDALSSTSYTDIFPPLYFGLPIPIDTTGYRRMGMVLLWNKNGGTGTHTVRLVKCGPNGVIDEQPEKVLRETSVANGGYLIDFNYIIPNDFLDFEGLVKLQAKSSNGTDSPRFDGLWLYMVRR